MESLASRRPVAFLLEVKRSTPPRPSTTTANNCGPGSIEAYAHIGDNAVPGRRARPLVELAAHTGRTRSWNGVPAAHRRKALRRAQSPAKVVPASTDGPTARPLATDFVACARLVNAIGGHASAHGSAGAICPRRGDLGAPVLGDLTDDPSTLVSAASSSRREVGRANRSISSASTNRFDCGRWPTAAHPATSPV